MTTLEKEQMTMPKRTRTKLVRHPRALRGSTASAFLLVSLALCLAFPSSSKAEVDSSITNCPTGVTGLCTPGTFESATETVTETIETTGTGTTTTTTTTTDTTTTTVTNQETGDLLTDTKVNAMGRNQKFGGDMTSDWGGQGPASMRNGSTCGGLGTDKCAEITGGSTFTSTLGQAGVGSTFIQHIDMTHASIDPDIERGGQVPWSIRVEKRDASDSIHFRIRKTDGTETVLLGTQTLSAAGANAITNTLFQGNFNFSGAITSLSIEVSGRDINLGIGPLFDDVTVNVIYNVVNTIVTQTITTIEEFVALGTFDQETIDVATDIFENNDVSSDPITGDINIQQPETDTSTETSYESVETEINDVAMSADFAPTVEVANVEMVDTSSIEPVQTVETVAVSVETEIQTDIEASIQADLPEPTNEPAPQAAEPTKTETASTEPEPTNEPVVESTDATEEAPAEETTTAEAEPEPEPETATTAEAEQAEPEATDETSDATEEETEEKPVVAKADKKDEQKETKSNTAEKKEEPKKVAKADSKKEPKKVTEKQKRQKAKEKAAKKIVKKMGDKGKYETGNQLKTLVVMQVLGNTKEFFSGATVLPDATTFYQPTTLPDANIPSNNAAQYLLFGGSSQGHNDLVNMQYK
jgi:hypothetical protein